MNSDLMCKVYTVSVYVKSEAKRMFSCPSSGRETLLKYRRIENGTTSAGLFKLTRKDPKKVMYLSSFRK